MKRRPALRKGFTLIETLTYMFCAVLLLGLAIQLIHTSLGISTEAKQQWQQDATLARMTRDLRRDLTHSVQTSFSSETGLLNVTLEDGRSVQWSFELDSTNVVGQVPRRTEVATNSKNAVEFYILPGNIHTKLEHLPNSSDFQLRVTSSRQASPKSKDEVKAKDEAVQYVKLLRIVHGSIRPESSSRDHSNDSASAQSSSEKQP